MTTNAIPMGPGFFIFFQLPVAVVPGGGFLMKDPGSRFDRRKKKLKDDDEAIAISIILLMEHNDAAE